MGQVTIGRQFLPAVHRNLDIATTENDLVEIMFQRLYFIVLGFAGYCDGKLRG